MSKRDDYRRQLREIDCWDDFLRGESGLPGRRGNLELAQAVADEGSRELFLRYAAISADEAPTNSPGEFLAFCGVEGLGRLIAEGASELWPALRRHASDPRWRTREAVAMALQRVGAVHMDELLAHMQPWSRGKRLEQRAAAAGLCEPRLLQQKEQIVAVYDVLDTITSSMIAAPDRHSEPFRALRQGMGYCWSVAVVALPDVGKSRMTEWLTTDDPDVRWVMRENLKKARLKRMDADWVAGCRTKLGF